MQPDSQFQRAAVSTVKRKRKPREGDPTFRTSASYEHANQVQVRKSGTNLPYRNVTLAVSAHLPSNQQQSNRIICYADRGEKERGLRCFDARSQH